MAGEEPGDESRAQAPVDRLFEFVVEHQASFALHRSERGYWVASLQWGQEAPDSPMVGAAAYAAEPTAGAAVEALLVDAGAWP